MYIFKEKRAVFFLSCAETTGSICLFCNAQSLLLFMHTRPFVFLMQGKNVLSLV